MNEAVREIHTESDITAYQDYLRGEWCEKTSSQIQEGTILKRLFIDLELSWRSTSYTAQLPATSILAMHAAALGRGKFASSDRTILAYSEKIVDELIQRLPGIAEICSMRSAITRELVIISAETRDEIASKKEVGVPVELIWSEFMGTAPFRLSLWSSQRVSYVAFFNAYEVFLVNCLKVGTGRESLRSTVKEFKSALREGLDKDISEACWHHHDIRIVRDVRHALIHNGGRETKDLKTHNHGIRMCKSELQIVPADIKRMLSLFMHAVDEIISVTRDNEKFKQPEGDYELCRSDDE